MWGPSAIARVRDTPANPRIKDYTDVNSAMVEAYCEIRRRIEETVDGLAEYGKGLLKWRYC